MNELEAINPAELAQTIEKVPEEPKSKKIYNLDDFDKSMPQKKEKTFEEQLLEEPKKDEDWKAIRLGNRAIHIRKWKVKDRLKLKKFLQTTQDQTKQQEGTLNILVFGCIQEEIGLNKDELEYMFTQIRIHSIGDDAEFSYNCQNEECLKLNKAKMKVSTIYKPKFGKIEDIRTPNLYIQLQEIQNPKYYNKRMLADGYADITDLILHIKSINNEELNEAQILKLFEDLDTDEMDYILDLWDEMRFTLDRRNSLLCDYCTAENEFEFDEIPNLIPPIWFRR